MTKKKEREKINRAIHMNNAMNIKKCPNYFSFFTICAMRGSYILFQAKKSDAWTFLMYFFNIIK